MRKILVAVALYVVIAFPFSAPANFSSVAQAMPAPVPDNVELSVGLAQWGAESDADDVLEAADHDAITATLRELARPYPTSTSKAAMCETLAAAAQTHDLPVGFFVRLINQESGFNPEVVSPAGAQGVAQFMPKVAEEWGLKNPFDPHQALVASARFLRSLYNQFGNWGLAAAAYNGGMGRVQKWVDKRGKLPDETRHYVMTITGVPAEKWVGTKTRGNFSIPARAPCQEIAYLADAPTVEIPLPRPRQTTKVKVMQASATPGGKPSKVAVITVKRGTKVAVISVKGATKVAAVSVKGASKIAAVTTEIAAPKAIVADAGFTAALPKNKRGKAVAAVKVAEKSSAKAKDGQKSSGKGRVQVADARGARK
jgi:soluble lytic murein transglycosylase-like protein